MSPAEERAEREGLPVVLTIPFELINVAQGHPMILEVTHADGTRGAVLVRLYAPRELRDAVTRHQSAMPPDIRPETLTAARAAELCRPLPDFGA